MADKTNNSDTIRLSNTEEQLMNDPQGHFRDQLLADLLAEATRLKQLKDQGAAPEDFSRIDTLLTSIVAAMEVVDKNWRQHHKS